MKRCLIFANGAPNDGPMVRDVLSSARDAVTIAADGGARVAGYFGRQVDFVIGDMDSLEEAEIRQLAAAGAESSATQRIKTKRTSNWHCCTLPVRARNGYASLGGWGIALTRP